MNSNEGMATDSPSPHIILVYTYIYFNYTPITFNTPNLGVLKVMGCVIKYHS